MAWAYSPIRARAAALRFRWAGLRGSSASSASSWTSAASDRPSRYEHRGQVLAGGGEAGGDLQAADQQGLGLLLHAAQPGDGLGQHPDRGRLVGAGLQQGAQGLLGLAGLAVDQGDGGGHRRRVADPALDLPGAGDLGAVGVAQQVQRLGEAAPALDQVGFGGDRAPECGDGALRLAGGGRDPAVLQLDRRRPGKRPATGDRPPAGPAAGRPPAAAPPPGSASPRHGAARPPGRPSACSAARRGSTSSSRRAWARACGDGSGGLGGGGHGRMGGWGRRGCQRLALTGLPLWGGWSRATLRWRRNRNVRSSPRPASQAPRPAFGRPPPQGRALNPVAHRVPAQPRHRQRPAQQAPAGNGGVGSFDSSAGPPPRPGPRRPAACRTTAPASPCPE